MKNACRGFAFGSSQRNRMMLMLGAVCFLATQLKRLTQLRISHHTTRHARSVALLHAAQVLQATMNFSAHESARRVMRIQRLKRRGFSLSSARQKPRTAFTLPQRA
jgi:hypothetical protein